MRRVSLRSWVGIFLGHKSGFVRLIIFLLILASPSLPAQSSKLIPIDPQTLTIGQPLSDTPKIPKEDWVPYRNNELGFTFQFPTQVTFSDGKTEGIDLKIFPLESLTRPRNIVFSGRIINDNSQSIIRIRVERKPENYESLAKYINDFIETKKTNLAHERRRVKQYEQKQIKFNGYNAILNIRQSRFTGLITYIESGAYIYVVSLTYDSKYLSPEEDITKYPPTTQNLFQREAERFNLGQYILQTFELIGSKS